MKTSMKKRVMALALAALMVVGLVPTGFAAKEAKAATKTEHVDLSAGLKAGTVYGDEKVVTFTVLEDQQVKDLSTSPTTIDGISYTSYVYGTNNAKTEANKTANATNGLEPATGSAFKFNAVVDCKVAITAKNASSKNFHFVEAATLTELSSEVADVNKTVTFTMEAGKSYWFYLEGSKVNMFDLAYTYEAADDYMKFDADIAAGFKAGTTYGDSKLATFIVLEDQGVKDLSTSPTTIDGVAYTSYAYGTNNAKTEANKTANATNGLEPATGSAFKFTAVVDSKVSITAKNASSKNFHFVEASTLTELSSEVADVNKTVTFEMEAGKSYWFYLEGSKVNMFALKIEHGTPSLTWDDVAAPVLGTPVVSGGTITVPYTAVIGDNGAESITITMKDEAGEVVDTQMGKAPGTSGSLEFTPVKTGKYTFSAVISRDGQEDKASVESVDVQFKLPLAKPVISGVPASKGNGSVEVGWFAVDESTGYYVEYSEDGTTWNKTITTTATAITIDSLTVGKEYSFRVVVTGEDCDPTTGDAVKYTVENAVQERWLFSAFGGSNATTKDNFFEGGAYADKLLLTSNKGKLVEGASADEIAYYYTQVPANVNATLSGKITVKKFASDGGQTAFGIMATDGVGESGTGAAYYTNSVATYAGKVVYYYNPETGKIASEGYKLEMKNGIGARYKIGSTATDKSGNGSVMYSLDKLAFDKQLEAGIYNVIKNGSQDNAIDLAQYEVVNFTLKKDNTGFLCVFADENGNVINSKRIYDLKNAYLTVIEPETYNIGFFAARGAEIEVSDIKFTKVDAAKDAPAEAVVYDLIEPSASITTTTSTSVAEHEMQFAANADGNVVIKDATGALILSKDVLANETVKVPVVTLNKGKNNFEVVFTPNATYQPSEYEKLSSYEPITFTHTVTFKQYGTVGQAMYVSPNGTSKGDGTKVLPLDIYTAVKFVQPGQQILIMEGTYLLENTVKIARGVNGTEENMIYLLADPEAKTRPVFDFTKSCAGFVFGGDYWYAQGFDVTHSGNKMKAIQVSGNNNTLDKIEAYNNGDTGIQISRLLGTDVDKTMWPTNNTILNCTSYNNADGSYADADGFAAKITAGEGNKFIGCIAHHNADDGWDLFAYPNTGSIGKVVVDNCLAYMNGYVLKNEAGELDPVNGKLVNAGNGNGFKLGGNSITGYHELNNSVAFYNKAKGIDCNSCPDIQVTNSISYNNGSYNVAYYSSTAANTDYLSKGVISFRTENLDVIDTDGTYVTAKASENKGAKGIKMIGKQDAAKVINESSYYWYPDANAPVAGPAPQAEGDTYGSYNSVGAKASADWFVSLDFANLNVTRDADGSINLNGFLELTDKAPADAGARLVATPSLTFTAYSPVPTGDATNVWMYIVLLVLAAGAMTATVVVSKKNN